MVESLAAVRDVDEAFVENVTSCPAAIALVDAERSVTYAALNIEIDAAARALSRLGTRVGERIAVIATKRVETVAALFGAIRLGAVVVPLNPLLKSDQIGHALDDSGAALLIAPRAVSTSMEALLEDRPAVRQVVAAEDLAAASVRVDDDSPSVGTDTSSDTCRGDYLSVKSSPRSAFVDAPALILYTSGSTAEPKGVVVSRANLAYGAASVGAYLEIGPDDRLLALMPLSFDYGLNQVVTALVTGARAVLFDYLLPRGIVTAVVGHRITGLPAVPHLWNQLARLDWPSVPHLRYATNTGGHMPVETTRILRRKLPETRIVLMYGFTEAFRSTWLPPTELDRRPDSIGRAVPHATVLVVDADGNECPPGEVGELIHGGPLVTVGYWNDSKATHAKFRPRFAHGVTGSTETDRHAIPTEVDRNDDHATANARPGSGNADRPAAGIDRFAWSGDLVRRDEEGFLYFVSRREELAKLHGYRVNPAEIEETISRSPLVREVCVVCVPHTVLGQAAVAVLVADEGDMAAIERHCRDALPRFMQPERLVVVETLPSTPNSKVDRATLRARYAELFEDRTAESSPPLRSDSSGEPGRSG